MPHEDNKNDYAIFISYSSKSDYRLARKLHAFIGSFHRTPTAKKAGLGEKALKACLDGFDFKLPAGKRENGKGETGDPSARVSNVIVRHLALCTMAIGKGAGGSCELGKIDEIGFADVPTSIH